MNKDEALRLLKSGDATEWNRRRANSEPIPTLRESDLSSQNLVGFNLSAADLQRAWLVDANLANSNLSGAFLKGAVLCAADFTGAILRGADLSGANLEAANLSAADLSGAVLYSTNFTLTILRECNFQNAKTAWTSFPFVDLSTVRGLELVEQNGPSSIGIETIANSKGRIPQEFLSGSGLTSWETLGCQLYDRDLTASQIHEIQRQIFHKLTEGPQFIGTIFISYTRTDAEFVDKLHPRLQKDGARIWRDTYDAVAGPIQPQVSRVIQTSDTVVVVLSKNSIASDWVENELELARKVEKKEARPVICPISLDDSWKSKIEPEVPNRTLWMTLTTKNVIPFADWNTDAFETSYQKLLSGLKFFYPPSDGQVLAPRQG
jgi:hypothetical protein